MTPWVNDTLKELSNFADIHGFADIKYDIARIEQQLQHAEFEIYRHNETDQIIASVHELNSYNSMSNLLAVFCNSFGIKYVASFFLDPKIATIGSKFATNFPPNWISEYYEKKYYSFDPIITLAKTGNEFFLWQDIENLTEKEKNIMLRAQECGIGPNGLTITYTTYEKHQCCMSFVFDDNFTHDSIKSKFHYFGQDLFSIAKAVSEAMIRLDDGRRQHPRIHEDSIEILEELVECGDIHAMRKRNVLFGSFNATEKSICDALGAKSLTHAAVIADRIGLLRKDGFAATECKKLNNYKTQ